MAAGTRKQASDLRLTYIVQIDRLSSHDPELWDRRTELFARGEFVRAFQGFDRQGLKRLEILDAALTLADLAGLPGNRLEALRGDRVGQYSIRINQQWRICFEWSVSATGPSNVEIVDYH
jgi:toxin HigB-1